MHLKTVKIIADNLSPQMSQVLKSTYWNHRSRRFHRLFVFFVCV